MRGTFGREPPFLLLHTTCGTPIPPLLLHLVVVPGFRGDRGIYAWGVGYLPFPTPTPPTTARGIFLSMLVVCILHL